MKGYKGDRTPHELLLEHDANASPNVWLLPALDLDALMDARAQRSLDDQKNKSRYYLPALPASGWVIWLNGATMVRAGGS